MYKFIFVDSSHGDLRDPQCTDRLFLEHTPTHVVHLAARVGGLFANMQDNLGFFMDNLRINMNIVEACHKHKVKHAVFCLSTCVFPAEAALPMEESALHGGPPHGSNEGYAYAKRMLECMVRYHKTAHKYQNWTCIIPTNIYGPHDNFREDQSHVIPALIRKCVEAKRSGKAFIVAGSGAPLRQFIHADDLAEIALKLLFKEEALEPAYIVCDMRTELSIGQVATAIQAAVGFAGEMVFDRTKADGIARKTASNKKLLEILGPDGFAFRDFDAGIKETVDWYLENETSARK